jgi:hypothetical protein
MMPVSYFNNRVEAELRLTGTFEDKIDGVTYYIEESSAGHGYEGWIKGNEGIVSCGETPFDVYCDL